LVGPPAFNRSSGGRGLGEAEALLGGDAVVVGDGLEVVVGVGLLVVVGTLPLLSAAAGLLGLATCSNVVPAITPATSTNTTTAAKVNVLLPILPRIVRYPARRRYTYAAWLMTQGKCKTNTYATCFVWGRGYEAALSVGKYI
jgi:hypothetical protein